MFLNRFTVFLCFILLSFSTFAVDLTYSRDELEAKWATRIQTLLNKGKLPLIDMQSSFKQHHIEEYIPDIFSTFDELGIALTAADGYQRPKDGTKGYRWSEYILELANTYPDYFIPTANGGTNKNWLREKESFIEQMEEEINSGKYYSMGELDFRHYMSNSQCRDERTERDNDIPLNGDNGQRIFELAEETGVPFIIHLEPEDPALDALEEVLKAYPKAKVIVAHFTQLRHPEIQKRFKPSYVRELLSKYKNLHYDLSIGQPNRKYNCAGENNNDILEGDSAIWEGELGKGTQNHKVHPSYLAILNDFSDRFMFATDFGGGRSSLPGFLAKKVENFNHIIRDLPKKAKHNIAYRNAWRLLTGKEWKK